VLRRCGMKFDPYFTVVIIILPSTSSSALCSVSLESGSRDCDLIRGFWGLPISQFQSLVRREAVQRPSWWPPENGLGGDYLAEGKTRIVTKIDLYAVAHGLGTSDVAVNRNLPSIPYAE
jgi:hypothetical protein